MTQAYQSSQVPAHQLDLFFDTDRWPRRPWCTDDLEAGLRVRSLRQAIEKTYIQANPPHLRVWSIFDVDRPLGGLAWEAANLPPPTWAAVNRVNSHAHLVWGLRAPVLVDGVGARDAPLRYLCAVESLMRTRLDADAGYTGLITKNPQHALWKTWRGPQLAYDLAELSEWLPGLEQHIPRRRRPELVGVGRHVSLFDQMRWWAYKAIRKHWGGGLQAWNAWLSECNNRALVYNADFPVPLDGREVWHVARSVAKWTWKHTTPKGFSDWQSAQGRKGGKSSGATRRPGSTIEAAPWAAEGISRATWYRRRSGPMVSKSAQNA